MISKSLLLIIFILFIGLLVGFYLSPSIANQPINSNDLFRESLNNIPSWFGALAGIFGSTFLSYQYSTQKQTIDDLRKDHKENIKNAKKALITLSCCFEELKSVKRSYINSIVNSENITRALKNTRNWNAEIKKESINSEDLFFIFDHASKENKNILSPMYIHISILQYNDITVLLNQKNSLGKSIIAELLELEHCELNEHVLSFDLPKANKKLYTDIIEFIRLSEQIFTLINQNIDHLTSIIVILSIEMQSYIKTHKLSEKFYSVKFDDSVFIEHPEIDVNTEIKRLLSKNTQTIDIKKFRY